MDKSGGRRCIKNGNTRAVVDGTGEAREAYEYFPYGRISRSFVGTSGTDEKFTGKEFDNNFGERVYFFGARYYDADLGIWLRIDPLAHLRPGFSPYNYCQLNPINRFDPNGMIDWPRVFSGAGGIVGGALQVSFGMGLAVGTSATGVGIAAGLAISSIGTTTIGFGTANLIEALKMNRRKYLHVKFHNVVDAFLWFV